MKTTKAFFYTLPVVGPLAVASACGGATEINYVEESAGGTSSTSAGGNLNIGGSAGEDGNNTSASTSSNTSASTSTSASGGNGGTVSTSDAGGAGGATSATTSATTTTSATATSSGGTGSDGCRATGCPAGEYCDGDTGECNPKKAAGEACTLTDQCQDSDEVALYCRDGVCCLSNGCPQCLNCGGDGTCSIVVADEPDVTGSVCNEGSSCDAGGTCRSILGQPCGDGADCVSGNCVDNVCCSESECADCMNCGGDGACSVAVYDQDDTSSTCNGITTCDPEGACVSRWRLLGATGVTGQFYPEFTATVGETLYFANNSNSGGTTQYHVGFDVSSGVFSDAPLMGNEYCACGYMGVTVSDDSTMYYFANGGVMWTPSGGGTAWTTVPGYTADAFYDGESATAVSEGRVYRVGGRSYPDRLSYYETATGVFVTTGLADYPISGGSYWACAGAANGRIYVFGSNQVVSEYNPQTDTWSTATDPNAPQSCSSSNLHLWGTYLVYAYGDIIKLFDTSTLQWLAEGIPLPDTANLTAHRAMVADGNLYVLAYNNAEQQAVVYRFELTF